MRVNDGWILSDAFLDGIYQQTHDEGLAGAVFWASPFSSSLEFAEFCKRNILTFVFEGRVCVGYVWLTGVANSYAFGHFCFFRSVWGRTTEMGRKVTDYWFSFPGTDGPLLDTIIGLVPGFNKRAHAFVERTGFKRLGHIPKMLKNKLGDREDAVVFYMSRG